MSYDYDYEPSNSLSLPDIVRRKKSDQTITNEYREVTQLEPPYPIQISKRTQDAPQRWETDVRDLQRSGRWDEETDHGVDRARKIQERQTAFKRKSRQLFLGEK